MRVRRLILLAVSAVLAVIAIVALVAPVEEAGERTEYRGSPGTSSPTDPTESGGMAARSGTGGSDDVAVLQAGEADQRVRLPVGTALRVQVESDEPVGVQIGDDGPVEYAGAGAPAEFAVFGEDGFDEPVRLLESKRVIGRVTAVRRP